jgi:hypothetical protein
MGKKSMDVLGFQAAMIAFKGFEPNVDKGDVYFSLFPLTYLSW